jgi:hypothetical protein
VVSWAVLRYYNNTCMEDPRKTMKNHNQDSISLVRSEVLMVVNIRVLCILPGVTPCSFVGTHCLHFQATKIDGITSDMNIIFSLSLSSFSTQQSTEHGHYTISNVSLVIVLRLWQNWVLENMLSEMQ